MKNKNIIIVKRLVVVSCTMLIYMSLFACSKTENTLDKPTIKIDVDANLSNGNTINENKDTLKDKTGSNKTEESSKQIIITPEEAARGKTVENTRRTVNEYGVTIYGKPISEQEAINKGLNSEIGIENDKTRGVIRAYTEYYSDAYGGKVFLKINEKNGGIEIFNEKGDRFMAGEKPQNDIEVVLANYRMGNAMAEAIDRTYNK